ncbi:RDD domain containing protein [Elusimicrobium minutum Pei191]|uniref:RDD domain containing protein n=1 Tax=Elusimicrobium minutum (strain Pei191) TaxID=445932 RepID=B2KBP7_ELUMP|nr:RDD family protein [Elusimicrobium minutum]ACC97734.1 RDD domain containing protein [Elusimicrobium minutum Pei191]
MTYAGFWKRFLAYIIDYFIVFIASFICGFMIGILLGILMAVFNINPQEAEAALSFAGALVGLSIWFLYFAIFESSKLQATPGKLSIGIRVTGLNGERITFLRALGRTAAKIISVIILAIGFIMAAFTQKKQALHDIIAQTLVINK